MAADTNQKRLSLARLAVSTIFFMNGIGIATWIARIPSIQQDLQLSTGMFGLALWGMAAGAIIAFPLTGWLITRLGSRLITTILAILFCLALPLPTFASDLILLWLALFILGACNGALDVAMNAQAVVIEERYGRPIMSSFHGLWSVGGIIGAGWGSIMAAQNIHQIPHFLTVTAVIIIIALVASRWLLPVNPTPGKKQPAFALPSKALIGIGIVALCAAIGEGAIGDWGAIYLHQSLGTSTGFAAAGFAIFAVAMTIARLTGDRLVQHIGEVRLVQISGIITALGLGVGLLVNDPIIVVIGFVGVGLGVACGIPLVFSAAGRIPGLSPGTALASVATMSYGGFLIGPPLIGGIAEVITLRGALVVVILLGIIMALLAHTLKRPEQEKSAITSSEPTVQPAEQTAHSEK